MADTDIAIHQRLFNRIARKKRLLDDHRPLPVDAVGRLHEEMRLFHTYHSDAIEGNTLTLQETKLVISEGITVGGKSLTEHLEVKGNAEAFDLIEQLASGDLEWDHATIQRIHEVVTWGQIVDSGKYRTQNVRIAGSLKSPPSFEKVLSLMEDYLLTIGEMTSHPLITSGYIHHRFVEIHPFIDGNGRVARLLTNMYLIRHGYPPVILKVENRKIYYASLMDGDRGDLGPLINFIARAMNESLSLYLSIFGDDDDLIPLGELADLSPYSQEYLSLRARQGMLDAVKVGNSWHSTRRALQEYSVKHGKINSPEEPK